MCFRIAWFVLQNFHKATKTLELFLFLIKTFSKSQRSKTKEKYQTNVPKGLGTKLEFMTHSAFENFCFDARVNFIKLKVLNL